MLERALGGRHIISIIYSDSQCRVQPNMNGTTSAVVHVNNVIFHTGPKLPELIPLGGHLELAEICQSYAYILREV
jgi:hypothetical protein